MGGRQPCPRASSLLSFPENPGAFLFPPKRRPSKQKAGTSSEVPAFFEKLAATYSRGVYKTTTIGKTVFDGRVRNGIGSDHSFMATKSAGARPPRTDARLGTLRKLLKSVCRKPAFSENCTQEKQGITFAS